MLPKSALMDCRYRGPVSQRENTPLGTQQESHKAISGCHWALGAPVSKAQQVTILAGEIQPDHQEEIRPLPSSGAGRKMSDTR